jgi:hypothetical protein
MYKGLSAKNGLLSAGLVAIALSAGGSGAASATSVLSLLEQPAMDKTSAVLSASGNLEFIACFLYVLNGNLQFYPNQYLNVVFVMVFEQTGRIILINQAGRAPRGE